MTVDEEALRAWLEEMGVSGARRVVAADEHRIMLSKTPPGFAHRLLETIDALSGALDDDTVGRAYAGLGLPGRLRVEVWEDAVMACVAAATAEARLPEGLITEIRLGVESVGALLRSVMWSDPRVGDGRSGPLPGEVAAFADCWATLTGDGQRFTRVYGVFDGRQVVNHCPGNRVARALFAQGWRLCWRDGGRA